MDSTLLLRLPANEKGSVDWWRSTRSENKTDFGSGTLALPDLSSLVEIAGQSRVIVLVPGELVNLTSLKVPGRVNNAVLKSLPYRLEDDLGSDADSVHVAVFGRTGDQLHLGVVDQQWMQQWLDWLDQAGITSLQWLPETLAVPWQEGQCALLPQGDGGSCMVRHQLWQAAVCDQEWLSAYLDSLAEGAEETLEVVKLDRANIGSDLLAEASRQKASLLQGKWQPVADSFGTGWRSWRLSLVLAATISCVWLGSTLWNTWQLEQQADEYQTRSTATYKELFPNQRIVRLVPQMQRELASLQGNDNSDEGLLHQLKQLAPVLSRYSEIKPVEVSYDRARKQLKVVAESGSMGDFSRLRDQISEYGNARLESVEQQGKTVTGVLVINGKQP